MCSLSFLRQKNKPWIRENQIKQHKKINKLKKKECKNCINFFISCACVAGNEAGKINEKGLTFTQES